MVLAFFRGVQSKQLMLIWILAVSLFFYGYWNPIYLGLLAGSMILNYCLGQNISSNGKLVQAKRWMILGVSANLFLLAYFKYRNFFFDIANQLAGADIGITPLILPLAISFFTFQQIAYLVDCYQKRTSAGPLLNYLTFVSFFPQLIAGPIVHFRDMNQQFNNSSWLTFDRELFVKGLALFSIGLFKKVVLADSLAQFSNPIFNSALTVGSVTSLDAVVAMFSYSFQLYFDFSGYADMALGGAAMLGLQLPINFNSPYRAKSIIEFWQRWHITLSSFLRDYLYIPLGGNRLGQWRRYSNLVITMLLGGLWHGAGWTFLLWGLAHGGLLVLNHCWRRLNLTIPAIVSVPVTFVAVCLTWVLFRAETFEAAEVIYSALFQPSGVISGLTQAWHSISLDALLSMSPATAYLWLIASGLIVLFLPNSQTLVGMAQVRDKMSLRVALLAGVLLFVALNRMLTISYSEFLYFNF